MEAHLVCIKFSSGALHSILRIHTLIIRSSKSRTGEALIDRRALDWLPVFCCHYLLFAVFLMHHIESSYQRCYISFLHQRAVSLDDSIKVTSCHTEAAQLQSTSHQRGRYTNWNLDFNGSAYRANRPLNSFPADLQPESYVSSRPIFCSRSSCAIIFQLTTRTQVNKNVIEPMQQREREGQVSQVIVSHI